MALKNLHSPSGLSAQALLEKDVLVQELMQCYDLDGNGVLSAAEFDKYVVDSLNGIEAICLA